MIQALSELIASPAGAVGLLCVLLLFVFALDKRYRLARPISDRITKLGEPFTDQLLRTIFAVVGFGAGLWVLLSQQYEDDVEKWAMGILGTVVGSYISSSPKGGPPYRRKPTTGAAA